MDRKINWDGLGIAASLACAIHCAVLPLFIASLPVLGLNIIENPAVEITMIGIALLIGIYALWHGYKKHHHRLLPLLLFITGMAFLILKEIFHDYHLLLLIPAVIFIITAHYFNFRFCRHHAGAHAGIVGTSIIEG